MGRPRLPSYSRHIIKFTSYNVLQFEFIHAAFPEVPALFLFRNPDSILASYERDPPPWIGSDVDSVVPFRQPDTAVEAFFEAALSVDSDELRCLEYSALVPERLPSILQFLKAESTPADLRMMMGEFKWDAKSGVAPKEFSRVPKARESPCGDRLQELYGRLRQRAAAEWE
jgi:hypothetical protein